MTANLSANIGFANTSAKQYAIVKQAASNNRKVEDENFISKEKGNVFGEKIAEMANPHVDEYVTALTEQDEASKAKKKYQPTVESLKERLEKSLEDRYDNAHNMLAEAFYGFKVNTCNSLLGLLGADPTELEAIKKKAYEQAKGKVQAGYERLAAAYAEYEIYAS
jgi:predicted metal-dependent hydrolase